MKMSNNKYNVVIVGAGITGLSAAYHLRSAGIDRVAIVDDQTGVSLSRLCPGLAMAGFQDNYTRLTHAYGRALGKELWQFSLDSLFKLRKFLNELCPEMPTTMIEKLRIVETEPELREVEDAVEQLSIDGFDVDLVKPEAAQAQLMAKSIRGIQTEGKTAFYMDVAKLLGRLEGQSSDYVHIRGRVFSIKEHPGKITVESNLGTIDAEMVVLANHLAIADLLDGFEDILISYGDQWFECVVEDKSLAGYKYFADDCCFSSNFGYEWGAKRTGGKWIAGGGRHRRKFAGIGDKAPLPNLASQDHVLNKFSSLFGVELHSNAELIMPLLGCRPCDELPIIGPLFGTERILIGTGYMGSGIAMGFAAGGHLSEIIESGRSVSLPQILHPKRLRSF